MRIPVQTPHFHSVLQDQTSRLPCAGNASRAVRVSGKVPDVGVGLRSVGRRREAKTPGCNGGRTLSSHAFPRQAFGAVLCLAPPSKSIPSDKVGDCEEFNSAGEGRRWDWSAPVGRGSASAGVLDETLEQYERGHNLIGPTLQHPTSCQTSASRGTRVNVAKWPMVSRPRFQFERKNACGNVLLLLDV